MSRQPCVPHRTCIRRENYRIRHNVRHAMTTVPMTSRVITISIYTMTPYVTVMIVSACTQNLQQTPVTLSHCTDNVWTDYMVVEYTCVHPTGKTAIISHPLFHNFNNNNCLSIIFTNKKMFSPCHTLCKLCINIKNWIFQTCNRSAVLSSKTWTF